MKTIKSSMAGNVWKILIKVGDQVAADQDVIILESMKMEVPVITETAGTVREIHCQEGDFVDENQTLVTMD